MPEEKKFDGLYQGKELEEVVETVKPLRETFTIFEENEAEIQIWFKKHHMKEGNTLGDHGGELYCVRYAYRDALDYMRMYEIDKDSDLRIEIHLKTYKVKKQKTGRTDFLRIGRDEYKQVGLYGEPIERIIWTSKHGLLDPSLAHLIEAVDKEIAEEKAKKAEEGAQYIEIKTGKCVKCGETKATNVSDVCEDCWNK